MTRERLQELSQLLFLVRRQVQRPDLLRSTEKRARRVAAAIVELDDVIQRRGLAVAEVGSGLRDLSKTLGAPKPRRNRLAAEIAVSLRVGVVAEVAVHVEVAVRHRRIADQRLIAARPISAGSACGESVVSIASPMTWKSSSENSGVLWQRDTTRLADEQLEALFRLMADGVRSPATKRSNGALRLTSLRRYASIALP